MSPLKVAVAQHPTQQTLSETLSLLHSLTTQHALSGTNLLLFPEGFLGGYPRTCNFGAAIGSRTKLGRDQYYEYWKQAVDLGDASPEGLGEYREGEGDGTRERLEAIAKETGVFLVVGMIEKRGGSLWCAVLFVCPERGAVGKRRKVMPTGSERVVWAVGSQKTLKAVDAVIAGQKVKLGAAICWENYMPLLRTTLYTQGVTIYLAPTADARPSWIGTLQHIALEGRCYVLGCNQFVTKKDLPEFIRNQNPGQANDEKEEEEVVCAGGSVIFDPLGKCVAGPLWGETGELTVEIEDLDRDVVRAKMDFDGGVGGHYSRADVFRLEVEGLEL